jgi:hypothetical protein
MRDGSQLIGWGMATETYPGKNLPSKALVRLQPDDRVLRASGGSGNRDRHGSDHNPDHGRRLGHFS